MPDGSVDVAVNLDTTVADKQLEKYKANILKTQKQLNDMVEKRAAAQERSVFQGAELDAEKQKLAELKQQLIDLQSAAKNKAIAPDIRNAAAEQIPSLRENISEQQQRVNALQREWNTTQASVERYYQKISDANAKLSQQVNEAGQLEQQIAGATRSTNNMPAAIERAAASMDKFQNRVKKLASRVFVFTLITRALRALRTWLWNSIQANDEAAQAVANLKGALLTLAQPILNVLIPAFTWLVNLLAQVVAAIARVVSLIFGSNIVRSAKQAQKSLAGEAGAIGDVGSAAKEAAGSLAGFDEINTIQTESSGGGGGGGGGGAGGGGATPDFASLINSSLNAIIELFSGLGLLALGAILAFSGVNIPLGLGIMAIGAALIADAVTTNWNALQEALQGPLGGLVAIFSGALLVLVALLAFSAVNIPIGLALMLAGAVGLVTAVAANWNAITKLLSGPIGVIVAIISGALLAIGLVLAMSGANIPLGLAMMVIGAAGLYASKGTDWGIVTRFVQNNITQILVILGGALLAIGAILAFSGVNIPLGIGLMIAGLASFAGAAALNWDAVYTFIQDNITKIVLILSSALLVLGAILTFSGANIPLGIGMMVVAVAGYISAAVVNWNSILEFLQGPIGEIVTLLSGALLVLGAILTFSGANIPLGLGMLLVGAAGMAASVAAHWNVIVDALQGPIGAITALVSAALLVIGIVLLFTGAGIPLGLGMILVGAAGLAAAIVPNWGWLKQKLAEMWKNITSWWNTNVAPKLSISYWKQKGQDIVDSITSKLRDIKGKINEIWENIKNWWSTNVAKYFTLSWWAELGKNIWNGIADGLDSAWSTISQKWTEAWEGLKKTVSDTWDSIWDKISGVINSILGGIEWFVNCFVSAFNSVFGFLNKFSISIPEWVPKFGGATWGFNIPLLNPVQIPRLAQGAVIPPNREFMAVLGDQTKGNNIEAPENLIRQIVREESGGNAEILREILSAIREGKVMMVDRQVLARTAVKGINDMTVQAGKNVLLI